MMAVAGSIHFESSTTAPALEIRTKGPFNNYMDKIRGRGSKMFVFVHAQGINDKEIR